MTKTQEWPHDELLGSAVDSMKTINTSDSAQTVEWPPHVRNMIVKATAAGNITFDLGDNPRADYMGKLYTVRVVNPTGAGGAGRVDAGGPIAAALSSGYKVWTMTPWGVAILN